MNWRNDLDLKLAFITLVMLVVIGISFVRQANAAESDVIDGDSDTQLNTPLFTVVGDVWRVENIKLPADETHVPWLCVRNPGEQKIACLIVNPQTRTASWFRLFLKRLET